MLKKIFTWIEKKRSQKKERESKSREKEIEYMEKLLDKYKKDNSKE